MPCSALSCPRRGWWHVADTRPLALDAVKILAALVPIHEFLPEACRVLLGSLGLAWVGAATDVRIPLIESLSQSVMRQVSAPGYMLLGMPALLFVR
jgi:hypothetical protein